MGSAVSALAAISLAVGYPTQASIPHSICNAFTSILSISLGCESYSFKQADMIKRLKENQSKTSVSSSIIQDNLVEKNLEEETEEEMDLGGGIDMFGGNDEEGY